MKPREVLQCDLNGNPMRIFKSVAEASRETGIQNNSIHAVAQHRKIVGYGENCHYGSFVEDGKEYERKTAGGYIWKYVDELEE